MKKVDTRRMQASEMRMIRMMCGKTFRDGIPNGLLRDGTGVEDIGNHLGKRLRWHGHLERMDETNVVKSKGRKSPRIYKERKTEKFMG